MVKLLLYLYLYLFRTFILLRRINKLRSKYVEWFFSKRGPDRVCGMPILVLFYGRIAGSAIFARATIFLRDAILRDFKLREMQDNHES